MKIVTNLQGTVPAPPPEWKEFRGVLQSASDCPAKGFYRYMQLQGAGLVMSRGKATVCIPIKELWKLAESIEPALCPPAAPDARSAAVPAAAPSPAPKASK